MATETKTGKTTRGAGKKSAGKVEGRPLVAPASAPAVKRSARSPAKPVDGAAAATKKRAVRSAPITPEQRQHYVEIAAFYIAERRGFAAGNPVEDWLAAEAEIDRLLAGGHIG